MPAQHHPHSLPPLWKQGRVAYFLENKRLVPSIINFNKFIIATNICQVTKDELSIDPPQCVGHLRGREVRAGSASEALQ